MGRGDLPRGKRMRRETQEGDTPHGFLFLVLVCERRRFRTLWHSLEITG